MKKTGVRGSGLGSEEGARRGPGFRVGLWVLRESHDSAAVVPIIGVINGVNYYGHLIRPPNVSPSES